MTGYYDPRFMLGRGAPGHPRKKHPRIETVDVWKKIRTRGSDNQLKRLICMTIPQFTLLLEDLSKLTFPKVGIKLTFSNKILCTFIWLVKYSEYSELATLFGTTIPVISTIIKGYLEILVGYFIQFIPH
ncbi:MAG: hypothetical protein ACXV2C_07935, partial [Candidatus Bathyarchaeia archaeon]